MTTFTLNTGHTIPALGLGVYLSKPEETAEAVAGALRMGYRLIDTAAAYGNEAEVGQGIRDSGIPRERIFVTTKLWIDHYSAEKAKQGFEDSMAKLGLDYLDLYLLHWPTPSNFDGAVEAYRALMKLRDAGRIRSIGVCNFNPDHMDRLVDAVGETPALNQIELHPLFGQKDIVADNIRRGVVVQAWSPIGGSITRGDETVSLMEDETLKAIAAAHGVTPAQAMLRWHFQNGVATIPKSVHAGRQKANLDIFGFELTAGEMARIDAMEDGQRAGPDPDQFDLAFIAARGR